MANFMINGAVIKPPTAYNPVFATTSTEDSNRSQDGVMHNTPMFTIEGYDITWDSLTLSEMSVILQAIIGKSSFTFYGPSPLRGAWVTQNYYASNYSMAVMTLVAGKERWTGLSINIRRIEPI